MPRTKTKDLDDKFAKILQNIANGKEIEVPEIKDIQKLIKSSYRKIK
jgi:hypothetical protein